MFFDKRLSRDGTLSCASCHDPKTGFSDGRRVALGIGSAEGSRNSPALINRGYGAVFFWDGRATSLERQAIEPILNPKELGMTQEELEKRTRMKAADVAAALASYVRTIRSGDSPFDRHAAGKSGALNALEKTGLQLSRGKAGCSACHIGPSFTDERFHNTGIAWQNVRLVDEGRGGVTGNEKDRGAFKTPTLREVARTAPYMHDGSLATLDDVVRFYSDGGRRNPNLDIQIQPRNFTPEETRALVAFLRALSGRVLQSVLSFGPNIARGSPAILDDQSLHLGIRPRSARFSLSTAVVLVRDQLPMPGKKGVWGHDASDLHQCTSAELLRADGKSTALIIGEAEASVTDLLAEYAILFG